MLTYDEITKSEAIRTYIIRADESLGALGYTEHSFAHVMHVAETAGYILQTLGHDARTVELAKIAGYLHDIGNLVNRKDHSQSGAVMAWSILSDMGCDPAEMATIVTAIGNHDEGTGVPVNAVAAAMILADKADVRRSRVRNQDISTFDIHDRVNYSVKKSSLKINEDKTIVKLKLTVDTKFGSVMDYFEIFLGRMLMCRRAAQYIDSKGIEARRERAVVGFRVAKEPVKRASLDPWRSHNIGILHPTKQGVYCELSLAVRIAIDSPCIVAVAWVALKRVLRSRQSTTAHHSVITHEYCIGSNRLWC